MYFWGRDGVGLWTHTWAFQRFSKGLTFLVQTFVFLMLKAIAISVPDDLKSKFFNVLFRKWPQYSNTCREGRNLYPSRLTRLA